MDRIKEIRSILSEFVSYYTGKELRLELNEISKNAYIKKHSGKEYLDFIEKHLPEFEINGNQNTNFPYYLCMFTEKSQHVYGDSIYECLDKAI